MSGDKQMFRLIEHYQKALRINPHSDGIYHQLAELYYQQGDLQKTLETCYQALVGQPNAILVLGTIAKVFMRLGFSKNEAKYYSEAIPKALVEESIEALGFEILNNEKNVHEIGTWKSFTILGYTLAQQSLWNGAIRACFAAITLEPSLNFPHFIIKYLILPKVDNVETLTSLYSQAIQLPRIHPLAYSVLGDVLTKQRKITEATQAYSITVVDKLD